MQFERAWPGRRVRTAQGETGTIVSRANGTVYVQLDAGDFRRFVVSQVEALDDADPPPRRTRRRRRDLADPRDAGLDGEAKPERPLVR
jgi:hypothetical protein